MYFGAETIMWYIRTLLLIWDRQNVSYYEKYKEQVTFQTMIVGNLELVLTNGNKTFCNTFITD